MNKIFDKETVKYIKDLGMPEDAIFNLQKNKLKEYAIQKLYLVITAIEKEDYSLIEKDTFSAGVGCYGDDTCLNFGGIMGEYVNIEQLFDLIKDKEKLFYLINDNEDKGDDYD